MFDLPPGMAGTNIERSLNIFSLWFDPLLEREKKRETVGRSFSPFGFLAMYRSPSFNGQIEACSGNCEAAKGANLQAGTAAIVSSTLVYRRHKSTF